MAAFVQGEVEPLQDPVLGLGVEVHEGVAADQQVEARDGRVLDEVVASEDHAAAQLLVEGIPLGAALEVFLEELLGDVLDLLQGVGGLAGFFEGAVVHVRRVDLDPLTEGLPAHPLGQQHGQRVGLLARGAAAAPHADGVLLLRREPGQDLLTQVLPGVRIAEEPGDVDEDRVEQLAELLGMDLEIVQVVGVFLEAQGVQPLAHPAHQARALVGAEVEASAALQIGKQRLKLGVTGHRGERSF
jgi:hypothetical protein